MLFVQNAYFCKVTIVIIEVFPHLLDKADPKFVLLAKLLTSLKAR